MRLKSPTLPTWANTALTYLAVALGSPVIVAIYLAIGTLYAKRWLLGPGANWSPWFAWHPVQIHFVGTRSEWRWLEFVERRASNPLCDIGYRLSSKP